MEVRRGSGAFDNLSDFAKQLGLCVPYKDVHVKHSPSQVSNSYLRPGHSPQYFHMWQLLSLRRYNQGNLISRTEMIHASLSPWQTSAAF